MRPAVAPARQAGTWFTYPEGMEGWVDIGGWLYRLFVDPSYWPLDRDPTKSRTHDLLIARRTSYHYAIKPPATYHAHFTQINENDNDDDDDNNMTGDW